MPEVLLRAVDRGSTYLTWRWLDRPDQVEYMVVAEPKAEAAVAALDDALITPRPGESGRQAAVRALTRGVLTDPGRERELSRLLGDTFLPVALRDRIVAMYEAGERVRIRMTPSPRVARVPWELLFTGPEQRLIEVATIVCELPSVLYGTRVRAEKWLLAAERPPLLIIDPKTPQGTSGLDPVLDADSTRIFGRRVREYGATGRIPARELRLSVGGSLSRVDLSVALRTPRSRLFYFGHAGAAPNEPGSASLHLNDTAARVWGLARPRTRAGAPPSGDDHRPLTALDLLLGTSTATEKEWAAYSSDRPQPGHELWPMPARVAIIACESGADFRAAETFGLVMAAANAGAELVTSTRWILPTDDAFRKFGSPDADSATSELALRVDGAHESPDPVAVLARWQRDRLCRWRDGDLGATPLVWAALINTLEP